MTGWIGKGGQPGSLPLPGGQHTGFGILADGGLSSSVAKAGLCVLGMFAKAKSSRVGQIFTL